MEETNHWIPVSGGAALHATVLRPGGGRPAAALIEALPYRKDDLTASYRGEYLRLVGEGRFAVVRVDLRGTGSSSGIAADEYPETEVGDLTAVIAWATAQPWCTGRVGAFGTSYSGFNALHLAAAGIAELGAVCAAYASDDRYTDDVHYYGGALRAVDLIDYVHYMVPMNALPPVPAIWGDGWQDEWRHRIDHTPPWLLGWLRHQVDGPGWRRGSIRTGPGGAGYDRIGCPTMLVGGWADGYRNNTFRAVTALGDRVPWRLLVGPWGHESPERARPGPGVDLVAEMIGWFDEHLRGGPPRHAHPVQLFVRRSTRPAPDLAEMAGTWRSEPVWPPARLAWRQLRPATATATATTGTATATAGTTTTAAGGGGAVDVVPVIGDVGLAAWISCAGALPWGQPLDQRVDDARSLTFDWLVEPGPLEIAGNARVDLALRSSTPVAQLSVKLCDVFDDGTSALITRGLMNLSHRGCWPVDPGGVAGATPRPLPAGQWVEVGIDLEATSWAVEAGHRLRLSIAGSDWPNAWPPPSAGHLDVDRSSLRLLLPVLDGDPPVVEPPALTPARPGAAGPVRDPGVVWRYEHDVLAATAAAVVASGADYEAGSGSRVHERYDGRVEVGIDDPARARAEGRVAFRVEWPEAGCEVVSHLVVQSDASAYEVDLELAANLDGARFASRLWHERIPRQLQ